MGMFRGTSSAHGARPGFWAGGLRAYLKALKEEERAQLEVLERRSSASEDPEEIERLEAEIDELLARYELKRREAERFLF